MENPSSFSSKSFKTYDVYMNFRGEDTRNQFTSHLYQALSQKGILTFMADDKVLRGRDLSITLLEAIEESECSVVIFSENYATSTWCLTELVKIVECREGSGQLIVPVYYHVDPSDVRRQKGRFAMAFHELEERFSDDLQKVESWRNALTTVANLSGWDVRNIRDEVEFIQKITADISERVAAVVRKKLEEATKRSKVKNEETIGFSDQVQHQTSILDHYSPSSFSSKSIKTYDVFMSFSGQDTRNQFTSHLYHALSQKGILTFLDDDSKIVRGRDISSTLLKAVEESECSIVVFSETYASSAWCLNELVKIVECKEGSGSLIFPIFYHVDPSHVWNQTGSFGEAFRRLEQRFGDDFQKMESWRDALKTVANVGGWLINYTDNQAGIVQQIAAEMSERVGAAVRKKEKATKRSVVKVEEIKTVAVEGLPGMDSLVNDFHSNVCESSANVRFIGICGMSGIGKTTLAKAYYLAISNKFEGRSFLRNVKEVCREKENGLVNLQTQLLSDILKDKAITIEDVHSGIDMIKKTLFRKKVLIVLDDVDKLDQLKVLAERDDWFGSGSIIIITTKDESLVGRMYEESLSYKVMSLETREALQLFYLKSFKSTHPVENFIILSRQLMEYANGVPLALELLGSFLWTKSTIEWESTLNRLEKYYRELEIVDILQICFDELEKLEKHIFLDIAYFFNGYDKDYVMKIMDDSGFSGRSGIRILIDKSLLRIDQNDNTLWMHELIQEMGKEIVRKECRKEPEGRSRLWDLHYCPYPGA